MRLEVLTAESMKVTALRDVQPNATYRPNERDSELSETSAGIYQTTRRNIPEVIHLHFHL
jgi:hypothetical protein